MKETQEKPTGLPENAFRPLKPGEKYEPLMSPGKTYPEVCQRPEHHPHQRIAYRTEPRCLQACVPAYQRSAEQDTHRPTYFGPEIIGFSTFKTGLKKRLCVLT